jgi:hypothetical protein
VFFFRSFKSVVRKTNWSVPFHLRQHFSVPMRGLRDQFLCYGRLIYETRPPYYLSIARTLILKYLCQIINELRKRETSRGRCFAKISSLQCPPELLQSTCGTLYPERSLGHSYLHHKLEWIWQIGIDNDILKLSSTHLFELSKFYYLLVSTNKIDLDFCRLLPKTLDLLPAIAAWQLPLAEWQSSANNTTRTGRGDTTAAVSESTSRLYTSTSVSSWKAIVLIPVPASDSRTSSAWYSRTLRMRRGPNTNNCTKSPIWRKPSKSSKF